MKQCAKCKQEKPLSEFHKQKRAKDGLQFFCKDCDRERKRNWKKINKERNPERLENYAKTQKARKYGINRKELDSLLKNEVCQICGEHCSSLASKLGIDHNHNTKQIRGVLCLACNTALGSLKVDDFGIELLCSAISYLRNNDDSVEKMY